MEYQQLGKTELHVSKLSLGTVELGLNYGIASPTANSEKIAQGQPPPAPHQAAQLLHQAIDAGINFIDTARAYGLSEEIIGRALQKRRQEIYIATKVGCLNPDGKPLRGEALQRHMRHSVANSLKYLRTDYVDLLLIHNATVPLLQANEALPLLTQLQQAGLTRYTGVSTYGTEAPQLAMKLGKIDALQVAYNVLDQQMADEVFPLAQTKGVGLIVRSVYLKGVLTDRAEHLPDHLEALKERSRAFRTFVKGLPAPLSPVQAALRFVLTHPQVTTALVGVQSTAELTAAVQAAEAGPLTPEVLLYLKTLRWNDPDWLNPSTWGIP